MPEKERLDKDRQTDIHSEADHYVTFFSPNNEIEVYTNNLPHWRQEDVWYFVTFRLHDSLPKDFVEQIRIERNHWLATNGRNKEGNYSKQQLQEYYRLFSERIEQQLNSGYGSCILKNPVNAAVVANTLTFFANQRYILDAWVIMPNHVHVLVKPINGFNLWEITHSWKSFSATKINELENREGQLWMHESHDHIVRSAEALDSIRDYIRLNPQKAGLQEGTFLLS